MTARPEKPPISTAGEAATYLEGRISMCEFAWAYLVRRIPFDGGHEVFAEALVEMKKQSHQSSEPGFRCGFEEGADRMIDHLRKLGSHSTTDQ